MREFRETDVAAVERLFRDPYAQRHFPLMQDQGAAERFIEKQIGRYREYGHGLWILERREDGEFVGDCGLTYQRAGEGEVLEVGYHVVAEHRRQGYATEAATACRDHAFEKLEVEFVASIVAPDNEASRTVAQRVHRGMRWFERDEMTLCLYFTEREVWERERGGDGE